MHRVNKVAVLALVSLLRLRSTSIWGIDVFWIARDGDDIYIYWGGILIGVVTMEEWSFAIVHPKQPRNKAA